MSDLIRVTLQPDSLQAGPGEEIQAEIQVQNAGLLVDAYSIEVLNLDPGWFRLSSDNLPLFPGDAGTVSLVVRPPVGSDAVAQSYEFTINVVSSVDPSNQTSVSSSLEVSPVYSFDSSIFPEKVTGPAGSYNLSIVNTGNAQITFDLQGSDPEGFCRFAFQPEQPVLPPWEKLDVSVSVRPRRRPIYGKPKAYNLTVNATPDKTPEIRTLHVQLDAIAKVRPWYIPVAILSLVLLIVIGYSAFWGMSLRDSWTYFGAEKWDEVVDLGDEMLKHGEVYPFVFSLTGDEVEELFSDSVSEDDRDRLRIDVSWKDEPGVAPSVMLILKSPGGDCSEPKTEGRAAGPFPFHLNFNTPCNEAPFGDTLINAFIGTHRPAKYNFGEPLIKYCASNIDTPEEEVIYSGPLPKIDTSHQPPNQGKWTLYVVNQSPFEAPPVFVKVKMKVAVAKAEPPGPLFFYDGTRRHQGVKVVMEQFPVSNEASDNVSAASSGGGCGAVWDTPNVKLAGSNGDGIEHGVVLVRRLVGCPRRDTSRCDETNSTLGHLKSLTLDATWEPHISTDRVFIILRDPKGNCWSNTQGQTSEQEQETPHKFDLTVVKPCSEELTTPLQKLWNFIDWRAFAPSKYENIIPLVKFCRELVSGNALFTQSTAIPVVDKDTWATETTAGWHLYVINPDYSEEAIPALVTLKVKGDESTRLSVLEPQSTTLRDTPFSTKVPCGA